MLFFKPLLMREYNLTREEIIGNITTILKILILTAAPGIAVYIGTDEQTVIAFLTACLTFALAVCDAKYPNDLRIFQKTPISYTDEDVILNDEYTTSIDEVELDE